MSPSWYNLCYQEDVLSPSTLQVVEATASLAKESGEDGRRCMLGRILLASFGNRAKY